MRLVKSLLADLELIDRVSNYEGAMPENMMVRIADITDGTSNTILAAEDAGRPARWQGGQNVSGPLSGGGPWASAVNPIEVWGASRDGRTYPGPCAINCTNEQQVYSFHPGGANILFADGSTRFLRANIDIRVFARLVTRAGGEVVSLADE